MAFFEREPLLCNYFQGIVNMKAIPATSPADENATNFQEFSTFQQQPSQFFQHPHFPNEHITQEQIFPQSFRLKK